MQDPRILELIAKQMAGSESTLEKEELAAWLSEDPKNKTLLLQIKKTWQDGEEEKITFRKRFTRKHITKGLVQETLASLVGFVVGIWVSSTFTHYVTERKGIRNLFGILGRKKKVVNDIPEWMQFCLSILLGFIALELINYFFESKKHVALWKYIKREVLKVQ